MPKSKMQDFPLINLEKHRKTLSDVPVLKVLRG